jgi:hypothetical protein
MQYAHDRGAIKADAYLAEMFRLCPVVGLDALLAVAQSAEETSAWTSSWWTSRYNPAGIGITGDPTQDAASHTWADGVAAAHAHVAHLLAYTTGVIERGGLKPADDPRYDAYVQAHGAVGIATTLADLATTWATDPSYAVNIAAIANQIASVPLAVPGPTSPSSGPSTGGVTPMPTYPSYAVAGLATKIVLPVPLIQAIIPTGQTNQRPGIPRQTPGFWVQHETANTNPGADAAMHARYLANGADGSQVSWHFTVDDHQIYQHIPIDEVTWQAADGAGPGNMSGVSCELCVNSDGDKGLIRRNGEALCGTICAALGLTVDQIKRHYDFNAADPNRHHCPDEMMNEGYWPQFVANAGVVIAANTAGAQPAPTPTPTPTPQPVPVPGVTYARKHPIAAESATAAKFGRAFTVKTVVTPRQAADPAAPAVGPDLPVGYRLTAAWVTIGKDGQLWGVGSGGSHIPLSALQ